MAFFDCKTRHYCLTNGNDDPFTNNFTTVDEFGNLIILKECPGYLKGDDSPGGDETTLAPGMTNRVMSL